MRGDGQAAAAPQNASAAFRQVDVYRSLGIVQGYAGNAAASEENLRRARAWCTSWIQPAITRCCTPSRAGPMGAYPAQEWSAIQRGTSTELPPPAGRATSAWSSSSNCSDAYPSRRRKLNFAQQLN